MFWRYVRLWDSAIFLNVITFGIAYVIGTETVYIETQYRGYSSSQLTYLGCLVSPFVMLIINNKKFSIVFFLINLMLFANVTYEVWLVNVEPPLHYEKIGGYQALVMVLSLMCFVVFLPIAIFRLVQKVTRFF
jgi:hypothetical protein